MPMQARTQDFPMRGARPRGWAPRSMGPQGTPSQKTKTPRIWSNIFGWAPLFLYILFCQLLTSYGEGARERARVPPPLCAPLGQPPVHVCKWWVAVDAAAPQARNLDFLMILLTKVLSVRTIRRYYRSTSSSQVTKRIQVSGGSLTLELLGGGR